jgi:hypothetical protein
LRDHAVEVTGTAREDGNEVHNGVAAVRSLAQALGIRDVAADEVAVDPRKHGSTLVAPHHRAHGARPGDQRSHDSAADEAVRAGDEDRALRHSRASKFL